MLINADCLEAMRGIPPGSVDMILCDLPYGTTACSWDSIIPFDDLWSHYRRLIKTNGAIVLTASQPFTTALIASNMKEFKYCWVWEKEQGVNFQLAKKQPLKVHEDICVFGQGAVDYRPQGLVECSIKKSNKGKGGSLGHVGSEQKRQEYTQTHTNYPRSVQFFQRERGLHPTQKPVALFEYLIKTYTNPGELVLDNCAGSGTTAIAALNTGRKYICIERDPEYYRKAKERIENHVIQS